MPKNGIRIDSGNDVDLDSIRRIVEANAAAELDDPLEDEIPEGAEESVV